MHPKILLFHELVVHQQKCLKKLCELMHIEAGLENDSLLNYLEFSDADNNYTELLLLEIANEEIAYKLRELAGEIEIAKHNVENAKQALKNLL